MDDSKVSLLQVTKFLDQTKKTSSWATESQAKDKAENVSEPCGLPNRNVIHNGMSKNHSIQRCLNSIRKNILI